MSFTDAMQQFGWTELQAVKSAERKLTGAAHVWHYKERTLRRNPFATWTGPDGMRKAMLDHFFPGRLAKTVLADLNALHQLPNETLCDFQDRVYIVVDRKICDSMEEKEAQGAAYFTRVDKEVYFYMMSGVRKDILA